jgi:hypothetical protein
MMISDWDANDGRRQSTAARCPLPDGDTAQVSAQRNHAVIEIARDGQS